MSFRFCIKNIFANMYFKYTCTLTFKLLEGNAKEKQYQTDLITKALTS